MALVFGIPFLLILINSHLKKRGKKKKAQREMLVLELINASHEKLCDARKRLEDAGFNLDPDDSKSRLTIPPVFWRLRFWEELQAKTIVTLVTSSLKSGCGEGQYAYPIIDGLLGLAKKEPERAFCIAMAASKENSSVARCLSSAFSHRSSFPNSSN